MLYITFIFLLNTLYFTFFFFTDLIFHIATILLFLLFINTKLIKIISNLLLPSLFSYIWSVSLLYCICINWGETGFPVLNSDPHIVAYLGYYSFEMLERECHLTQNLSRRHFRVLYIIYLLDYYTQYIMHPNQIGDCFF